VYYRLGPLGFPQGAEASAKKVLNLGLKDIISGLQWVQSNIEVFSGDKNKVCVFSLQTSTKFGRYLIVPISEHEIL
jgi:carboxylesterase type B